MKYENIISQMTLEEKAGMCSGRDFWRLKGVERLGIPSIMVTDGPHGLRKQPLGGDHVGLGGSVPATCFPPACLSASSWDKAMLYKLGETIAEEALQEKVSVVLGPGANMKRTPLCGRNFEYFSEDPFLAGKMAANFINGVQSKGVGTSLKHYAGNNQETRRQTVDSVIDERTLREIYLTAFEIAVREAQPWTVMNAYNRLNGTYCAENKYLLTDILRDTFGFEGLVVTDWGAENDRVLGIKAGNELEMPSSQGINDAKIVEAVKNGKLDEKVLDERVDIILDLIFKAKKTLDSGDYTYDVDAHHQLARKMAANSMVLLKNDDNILPLSEGSDFAVIGNMAKQPRYQGAGSSQIVPTKLDNAMDIFAAEYGKTPEFAQGYKSDTDETDKKLLAEAVELAKSGKPILMFIGLTDLYESEAFDREHMKLPKNQLELIDEVLKVNDKVIILLHCGSPVELPFADKVKAILNCYLGGQAGAGASLDIIFGKVNPSGKLPETFPVRLADNPSFNYFPGGTKTVEYRESIYIGYRYYDTAKIPVRYPFGFGLSYTDFEFSNIKVSSENISEEDEVKVSFNVKNIGAMDGAEVCQIYVRPQSSTIFRPEKELKEFTKIMLKAGEEKTVTLSLNKRSFAYFNVNTMNYEVETGKFDILVGDSSNNLPLIKTIKVTSISGAKAPDYKAIAPDYYGANIRNISAAEYEKLLGRELGEADWGKDRVYDLNVTFEDMSGFAGGRFINGVIKFAIKVAIKGSAADKRMMSSMVLATPIRATVLMSNGAMSEAMAKDIITMGTGHFWKGFFKVIGKLPSTIKKAKGLL